MPIVVYPKHMCNLLISSIFSVDGGLIPYIPKKVTTPL